MKKSYMEKLNLERIGETEDKQTIKFLGILIDEKLNWKHHVEEVKKKLTNNTYVIASNKNVLPLKIRKTLYNSFIKPYMDYGAEIWGNTGKKAIVKVQKRCMRLITGTPNFIAHTAPMFRSLRILKFEDVIDQKMAKLCYKSKEMTLPRGLQSIIIKKNQVAQTRTQREFMVPQANREWERNIPRFKAPNIWNKLDNKIKNSKNLDCFKIAYKKQCIDSYSNINCQIHNCQSCKVSRPNFN